MDIKSAQQGGDGLQLTRTMSSDSDHDALPGGSGASEWLHSINHRENAGGGRAADAQDGRQKEQTVDAREAQLELQELQMRGVGLTNVGAVLVS